MHGAKSCNLEQALLLAFIQRAVKLNFPDKSVGVIIGVAHDFHIGVNGFKWPFLAIGVHPEGDIGTGGQGAAKQVLRGKTEVLSAQLQRFISEYFPAAIAEAGLVMFSSRVGVNFPHTAIRL